MRFILLPFFLLAAICQGQTTYLSQDFNTCSLPTNWAISSVASGSADWQIGNHTSINGNGLNILPGSGCFAGYNDAANGNDASSEFLISPKMDITGSFAFRIKFDVFLTTNSLLYVEYSFDSTAWSGCWGSPGVSPGNDWQSVEVTLQQYLLTGMSDIWIRFKYKDFGFNTLGAGVDNIICEEPAAYDIKHHYSGEYDYLLSGLSDLNGAIINYGSQTLNYYDLNWQVDNGSVQSTTIFDPLSASGKKPYQFANGLNLSNGDYTLKVWTSNPNGNPDMNVSNDTLTYLIRVRDNLPVKRVLLEKFTHTTCGPCYQGDLDFEQYLSDHPFVTGVSIHNAGSDPMTITDGAIVDNLYAPAHPHFIVDRHWFGKNYDIGMDHYQGETDDLDLRHDHLEGVAVSIDNYSFNEITRQLSFDVVLDVVVDYDQQLALNAFILEDSVHGYQASAPNPNDYYHHHVLRKMMGGPWGNNTGIPVNVTSGQQYSVSFSAILPSNWDVDQISFAGLVQMQDSSDIYNREIINSTPAYKISETATNIAENQLGEIKLYPNPTESMLYLDGPGLFDITIYDASGRVVKTEQTYNYLDVQDLQAGSYFIRGTVNSKPVSGRFTKR